MIKTLLCRNLWFYLAILLLIGTGVDWDKCFHQRGRYLLGIWYNGFFQNQLDQRVYEDYLKRHGTTHGEFKNTL